MGANLRIVGSPPCQENRISLPGVGHLLEDVVFEEVVGHPKRPAPRVELLFLKVVTVLAVEVAASPGRLGEDLELAGTLGHARPSRLAGPAAWPECRA